MSPPDEHALRWRRRLLGEPMAAAYSLEAPMRDEARPPTVLWSVVALGALVAIVLACAFQIGVLIGSLVDGTLIGRTAAQSVALALGLTDSLRDSVLVSVADALLIAGGAFVAARHALHAPKLHGFLVAASILLVGAMLETEPSTAFASQFTLPAAFNLVLATLAGGWATRWPDSSRSARSLFAAWVRASRARS